MRVIPKPSRAAYPCQRVGAPIAFGGLTYLLSIFGLATAWHHGWKFVRQNRLALAGGCLLIGLICGAMVRNLCETRAMAATENTGTFVPADAPNAPIGTARGIYPGRVAWSYNTNACNWDGASGYWWSTKFNNQVEITVLMDNVICSVAGQPTVSNAWDALFRAKNGGPATPSYVKGQAIAIKINVSNGSAILYVTDGTTVTLQGRASLFASAGTTADAYKYCVANGTLVLDNGWALTNNTSDAGLNSSCYILGAATNVFGAAGSYTAPAGAMVNTNNHWNAAVYLGDGAHWTGGITLNARNTNQVSDGDLGFANRGVFTIGGQNTSGINTYANPIILGLTANKGKSVTLAAAAGGEVDFTGAILANGADRTAGVTIGDAAHAGVVKLTGANTYAGGTTVAHGTLLVNNTAGSGTGANGVTVESDATLGGAGIISGPVTVQTGGTLALNQTLGTLTINNRLTLGGNLSLQVKKALNFTGHLAAVSGGLILAGNGVLTVSNTGPAFAAGDTFQVFNQPLAGTGALTVLPTVPAFGLTWANNLALNGTLTVVAVATNAVSVSPFLSNDSLYLSWPTDHTGWRLQAQTNPPGFGLGTNWVTVWGRRGPTRCSCRLTPPMEASSSG